MNALNPEVNKDVIYNLDQDKIFEEFVKIFPDRLKIYNKRIM